MLLCEFSEASWHCGLCFSSLKKQPWGDGMWNYFGAHVCGVCSAPDTFLHLLWSFSPIEGGLARRRPSSTLHKSIHFKWRENERPFVCFSTCDMQFLALGCTSGQTIIAFSSLGSSWFSIWSLPLSDFTIRRGEGGVAGERGRQFLEQSPHVGCQRGTEDIYNDPETVCQGVFLQGK